MDKLEGRENKISQQRDKKLEEAREKRSSKNTIKIAAQLHNQKVTNS